MKKLLPLILVVFFIVSCEDSNPIEITTSTTAVETISVQIPQTNGTAFTSTESITQDLSEVVSNVNDVASINVDALSYKYKNVTGNTAGVVQSSTLVINGITVASVTNVNVAQEATNETVFEITDNSILDQLESLFLNNSSVNIQLTTTVLSDAGPLNFDLEVSIGLTATLN